MLGTFLRHYLELPTKSHDVVCLGGGIGTAQVLKGLRNFAYSLTAVVSMADDGGSAGRLRRAFSVMPPGDLVNCLAALSDEESILKKILLYRFAGKRYGEDTDLGGHKLGNLIYVALMDIYKGDTNRALEEFSRIISSHGKVLPATLGDVNIWAMTKNGKKIYGEQNIDLGKYNGARSLSTVHLDPAAPKAYSHTLEAIKDAQVIIAGPGDLFSTVLPVLIVPQIKKVLKKSNALKIFIVNIANKPFETPGFKASDYLQTIQKHLDNNIFDTVVINVNQKPKIPQDLKYQYVEYDKNSVLAFGVKIVEGDLVDIEYPLYHDSLKIAKILDDIIKGV